MIRLLPRSRRGTWLLAGAVWLAACAGWWWVLPHVPRGTIQVGGDVQIQFSSDGKRLNALSNPVDAIRVWNVASCKQVLDLRLCGNLEHCVIQLFERDAGIAITSDFSSDVRRDTLIDLANGKQEDIGWWIYDATHEVFQSSDGRYTAIAIRNDRSIVEGDKCRTIWWDRDAGKTVAVFSGVMALAVASDGPWLSTSDFSGELVIRAPASLDEICRFRHNRSRWSRVSLSPDGRYVAFTDEQTEIIDTTTGMLSARMPAHLRPLVFSDIRQAVAIDYTVHPTELLRWDLTSGESLGKHIVHGCGCLDSKPPDDGRMLVRIPGSAVLSPLRLWLSRFAFAAPFIREPSETYGLLDVRTGKELSRFQLSSGRVDGISLDNRTADSFGDREFEIVLWNIPPNKSLTWFTAGAALLALPIAHVARRRIRKLKAA